MTMNDAEAAAREDLRQRIARVAEIEREIGLLEDAHSRVARDHYEAEDRLEALRRMPERDGDKAWAIVDALAAGDAAIAISSRDDEIRELEARIEKLGAARSELHAAIAEKRPHLEWALLSRDAAVGRIVPASGVIEVLAQRALEARIKATAAADLLYAARHGSYLSPEQRSVVYRATFAELPRDKATGKLWRETLEALKVDAAAPLPEV